MKISTVKAAIFLMVVLAPAASAGEHEKLNAIYQVFFDTPVSIDAIAAQYPANIIHVGRTDTPLLVGKRDFMKANIEPLVAMLEAGDILWEGTSYIIRRVISGDMANDVGYLYSRIVLPDGREMEQVQKFSWVFLRENGTWRVITDFDATPAPLDVLDTLEPQIVVEASR